MHTSNFFLPSHRVLPPSAAGRRGLSSERAVQRGVWCQSQRSEGGPGPQSAKAAREACEEAFPSERLDLTPEDGLFPRRQPGNFPATAVKPSLVRRLRNAVSSLTSGPVPSASLDASPAEAPVAAPVTPAVTGETAEFDPLRDGPLRYLGYANECGEAFAAWLPGWGVPFSYAVAISYVLTDTYDKWARARKQARQELDSIDLDPAVVEGRLVNLLAAERAMDTVVWQMLASVAIPGYTIHTIVAVAHSLLAQVEGTEQLQSAFTSAAPGLGMTADTLTQLFDKSLPTMIGLAAIPFIVHPIDESVHAVMNVSLRPAIKKFLCGPGQGGLAGLALCEDCKEECAIDE